MVESEVKEMDVVKVNNRFDVLVKKDSLGVPMTPGNWVGEPEYKNVMYVGLSYGGGIGGAHREIYCTRINNIFDVLQREQFIEVELVDGRKEIINSRFIVNVHNNYQMMTVYFNNKNTSFVKGLNQYNVLVPNGHKVTLVNEFESWR